MLVFLVAASDCLERTAVVDVFSTDDKRSATGNKKRRARLPPDWSLLQPDGTFGNRFDDPAGAYCVLDASSYRLSCLLKTLARFRPDLTLMAELDAIEGDNDFSPLGQVPKT